MQKLKRLKATELEEHSESGGKSVVAPKESKSGNHGDHEGEKPPENPPKKARKTAFASPELEAFFASPATTATDAQNPGIKFVLI